MNSVRSFLYHNHPLLAVWKLFFYWPFIWLYFICITVPVAIYKGIWYTVIYLITFAWVRDIYLLYTGKKKFKLEKKYVGLALAVIALGIWTWLVNG